MLSGISRPKSTILSVPRSYLPHRYRFYLTTPCILLVVLLLLPSLVILFSALFPAYSPSYLHFHHSHHNSSPPSSSTSSGSVILNPSFQFSSSTPWTDLSDHTIDSAIAQSDYLFTLFYLPTCGHCQHFMPIFEEFARKLSLEPTQLHVTRLNAALNRESVDSFDITGVPTLILFMEKGKKQMRYEGERNVEKMWNWLQEQNAINRKYPG
jgi:thiol-disulfide isomerase/thioredoxin